MKKRLNILDFLRGIAILNVVVDHLFVWLGLTATDSLWHNFTIFSVVPLFFLAGITYCLSLLRHQPALSWRQPLSYLKLWWRKSHKLLTAYLIGLLVIIIWTTKQFSFADYWQQVITFPNQFYFIIIYLELLLVAPLFVQLYQKVFTHFSWGRVGLLLIGIAAGAGLLNAWPILPTSLWAPARVLFGGWELFVWAAGSMVAWLWVNKKLPTGSQVNFVTTTIGVVLLSLIAYFDGFSKIFSHPPNLWTLGYCLSLILLWGNFYALLTKLKFSWLAKPLEFAGQHSLAIYIYHALFIQLMLEYLITNFQFTFQPYWLWLIILTITTSLLSIALGTIIDWLIYTIKAKIPWMKPKTIATAK